jgi:mRNA-decapping enzyme subunit 2
VIDIFFTLHFLKYIMTTTTAEENPDWLEALEEVHTRFILNLPATELETADRMMFQVEQAWWFYEDCICDEAPEKNLPRFSNMKPFALRLFEYSPLLPDTAQFPSMWNAFSKYKRKISNYGCILLNEDCTKVVLCRVWNGKSYTFPSGKINQGEKAAEAAARETYEETGFDPHCMFGQANVLKQSGEVTWKFPLRDQDALVVQDPGGGKRRTNFVCRGVPEDFPFAPVARKEVSDIAWYPIDQLPKPNFAVHPFIGPLKRWIKRHHKGNSNARQTPKRRDGSNNRDGSRSRRTPNKSRQNNSRTRVRGNVDSDLVQAGLAQEGDVSGWSEEDMFATNERLLGRKVTYDGNPHAFEQGFGGQDPHAFRVVGEGFMNATVQSLASPPETSRLQPLFRKDHGNAETEYDDDLQPFFGADGVTPWGDVVADAVGDSSIATSKPSDIPVTGKGFIPAADTPVTTNAAGSSILAMLQKTTTVVEATPPLTTKSNTTVDSSMQIRHRDGVMDESIFLTDAEITAKSQAQKTVALAEQDKVRESRRRQYEADQAYLKEWVARLPKPPVTKYFGEFKLDADAIIEAALRSSARETDV